MDKEINMPEAAGEAVQAEKTAKKKGSKLKIALILLFIYVLVVAAVTVIVDARYVRFYMTGEPEMSLEYGLEYEEPGIYAVTNGRIFGEIDWRLPVTTEGQVDAQKLGSYELKYKASFLFRDYYTKRSVKVVDTTPPCIELYSIEGYEPSWFTGYVEEGCAAADNYDGDLSDRLEIRQEDGRVFYSVSDSSGNIATAEREIEYTVGKPEISLVGPESVRISARLEYYDQGAEAYDNRGNDMTEYLLLRGEVIPYVPGDYELEYFISNELGETVSAKRTITVEPVESIETVEPNGKTIYLTFDDGPGPYTDYLLDVLDRYDVKATFFVTGLSTDYKDSIGRAYREGHSIGVHSYTHNYYEIYDSEEAFFNDFNAVQEMIYEQTGSYTQLCRFPGGSSNTVSSFNPGIMSRLADALTNMGYKYFDWNVTSGDAGETKETDKIIDNVVEGCTGRKISVVLQHDNKDYSVYAVEQIIKWGRNNGYSFAALDTSSPDAHHGIAN